MSRSVLIKNKISQFNKKIKVSGDKSISIRWVLFSSLAKGVSTAKNLLLSEDVLAAIKAIKKLGIKSEIKNKLSRLIKHQLRVIPDMIFFADDSLDYIDKIDEALKGGGENPIK